MPLRASIATLVIAITAVGCDALRGGSPSIALDNDVIFVGDLGPDEIGEVIVPVYNLGTGTLVIDAVKSHCKCTRAQMIDEAAKTIPPGESGEMRVIINAADAPSRTPKSRVTIFSNDLERPGLSFQATANVSSGGELLDDTLDFGDVPSGEAAEARVRFRSFQHADPQLLMGGRLLTKPDFIASMRVEDVPRDEWASEDDTEYDLVAVLDPATPPGEHIGTLIVPHRILHFEMLQLQARATVVESASATS